MKYSCLPKFYQFSICFLLLTACTKDDTTPPPPTDTGTVTDVEGNVYKTIKIGDQIWMAENLKTTKYRNGASISLVAGEDAWKNQNITKPPAYCYVEGAEANTAAYGLLYTWPTVKDSRGLAPVGWHVPSEEEWEALLTFLGGRKEATKKLKEAGGAHWEATNTGTNTSGFTAVAAGQRNYDGTYRSFGGLVDRHATWWTSTKSADNINDTGIVRDIAGNQTIVSQAYFYGTGLSVRCIKD
jgi:uncharacterized protein (TIGR02145 family)